VSHQVFKKMKKYLAILSSILIITSCDIVEGPYLTDETINPIDTTTNTYVKKVLVEDFTGHKCPNCPDAARESVENNALPLSSQLSRAAL